MKRKMPLHIIAVTTFVVLLSSSCATMTHEEWLAYEFTPENQRYKLELNMANKDVPIEEQSFLYVDNKYGVKEGVFGFYSGDRTLVVVPAGNTNLFIRHLSNDGDEFEDDIDLTLESGQSYWVTGDDTGRHEHMFKVIPLTEPGIESYTQEMWDAGPNYDNRTYLEWTDYEAFRDYWKRVWEVRLEENKKQLQQNG